MTHSFPTRRSSDLDRAILGRPVLKRGAIGDDGIGEIIRDQAIPVAPDELFRIIGEIACIKARAKLAQLPLRHGGVDIFGDGLVRDEYLGKSGNGKFGHSSEERRVGQECVSTCKYRRSRYP